MDWITDIEKAKVERCVIFFCLEIGGNIPLSAMGIAERSYMKISHSQHNNNKKTEN